MTPVVLPRVFLPWVREGSARLLDRPDTRADSQPARAELKANLKLNSQNIPATVGLYGPGDVVGLDRSQVVRTEPPDGALGFRPAHFVSIEFARPDLPWLFTPLAAGAQDTLRPWLCLVVVPKTPGVDIVTHPSRPLPTIQNVPAASLPPPRELWAWAHAQVLATAAILANPTQAEMAAALQHNPALGSSRLLCPTKLQPNTAYYVCVVPAFKIGREAGLGHQIDDATAGTLEPAWEATGTVDLPVFYSWSFLTGNDDTSAAIFKASFRRLQVLNEAPAGVGVRLMEAGTPGYGLPSTPGTLRLLEATFRARHCTPSLAQADLPVPYAQALRARLDTEVPATAARYSGALVPVLGPPIYGQSYANQRRLLPGATGWLAELNLDPRHRVAAGLGTQIVQQQQERLVALAWQQAGELRAAQQRLRQAQLARSAGVAVLQNHLQQLNDDALLSVTAPLHTSVRISTAVATTRMPPRSGPAPFAAAATSDSSTLYQQIATSNYGQTRVTPEYRRASRLGPLQSRAADAHSGAASFAAVRAVAAAAAAAPRPPAVDGMVRLAAPGAATAEVVRTNLASLAAAGAGETNLASLAAADFTPTFQQAWTGIFQNYIDLWQIAPSPLRSNLYTDQVRQALVATDMNPELTVTARALTNVSVPPDATDPDDPLALLPITPVYADPMAPELIKLSMDWLLPGIDGLPSDSIVALETNPRFIEAFMVGLNHEMGRELLWRGFPVNLRGTFFRQFWAPPPNASGPDMPEIASWNPAAALGASLTPGGTSGQASGQIALVLRGELLRRNPDVVIHLIKAQWDPTNHYRMPLPAPGPSDDRYPVLRFDLPPDTAFLIFDVSVNTARGSRNPADASPGWCFVFHQRDASSFFGLQSLQDPADLATLQSIIAQKLGPVPVNSASIARVVLQDPLRVSIHADAVVPGC